MSWVRDDAVITSSDPFCSFAWDGDTSGVNFKLPRTRTILTPTTPTPDFPQEQKEKIYRRFSLSLETLETTINELIQVSLDDRTRVFADVLSALRKFAPRFEEPENDRDVTIPELEEEAVLQLLYLLLDNHQQELFDDEVESEILTEIPRVIGLYGRQAINILSKILFQKNTSAHLAAEVVRAISRTNKKVFYEERLQLLERCLYHPSIWVRDAATVALSAQRDQQVIPILQRASNLEKSKSLRKDMEHVIEYLKRFGSA